jgi:Domain of unknown function (DUF4279)
VTDVLTKATFRLGAHDAALTAAAVTRRLGLQPTQAFEAGTSTRRSPHTRDCSLWLLSSSEQLELDVDLSEQLRRLLAVLEPVATPLWELIDAGYEANWYCWVASQATEHAVELDRTVLRRLLALPGDLWLDVCGDGPDA